MKIILFGISHRTAKVTVREKYSLSKKKVEKIFNNISNYNIIKECVILSTCNRTEFYLVTDFVKETLKILYRELCLLDHFDDLKYFYLLEDVDVVTHLFKVASGLESQVIGETQILTQVKESYFCAKNFGFVGKYFNKLFQKGIEVGKKVRYKTKISQGNVSIVSIVFKMLENLVGELEKKKFLIIGTGKVSSLITKYLKDKNVETIFVSNKNYDKAIKLASYVGGKVIRFDEIKDNLFNSDIVISATASPHLILKKEFVEEIMSYRDKPLYMIDLSVPSDIDPKVKNVSKVILYNLDDLKVVREENFKLRLKEAQKAQEIVTREVEKFCQFIYNNQDQQKILVYQQ
jgi:glutamyl-tRNA reductase